MRFLASIIASSIVFAAGPAVSATIVTVELMSSDQGWWSDTIQNNVDTEPQRSSLSTGTFGVLSPRNVTLREQRGYATFDLSGIDGIVTAATLEIDAGVVLPLAFTSNPLNPPASFDDAIVELVAVASAPGDLSQRGSDPADPASLAIFDDLGNGDSYGTGSVDLSAFDAGNIMEPLPADLSTNLLQRGIDDINAELTGAIANSETPLFSIGLSSINASLFNTPITLDPDAIVLPPIAKLRVTFEANNSGPTPQVPLPLPALLLISGLAVLGLIGRRRV